MSDGRSINVVVPMSKIQSESNSQLTGIVWMAMTSCGSNVKDTIWKQFTTSFCRLDCNKLLWFQCQRYNLKAIHNCEGTWCRQRGCGSNVKDTIWKQFTTYCIGKQGRSTLWFQCQRYNLKAIHNSPPFPMSRTLVVVPMSKIQSESNSQRWLMASEIASCCGSNVKDTIWKQFTTVTDIRQRTVLLWFQCQRYNLKAIHNSRSEFFYSNHVVVPMSKIQSESNSQPRVWSTFSVSCCGSNVKDTIWKQFTTGLVETEGLQGLWFQCQRYNLKAIHNALPPNFLLN